MIRAVCWTSVATVAVLLGEAAWAQTTTRVSVSTLGVESNGLSWVCAISPDGHFVGFQSDATNLVAGDTNGVGDVFVRDLLAGTTERVSLDSSGSQGNGISSGVVLSADGRFAAFTSLASNLVPGDTNGVGDAFLRDRLLGTTERLSVDSGGLQANAESWFFAMSADGRYLAFASEASNLVASDTNAARDMFVRDRLNGTTERVSVSSSGAQGNQGSSGGPISADGRFVAFGSDASNLVAGDTNSVRDVFVRDLVNGTTERVSVGVFGETSEDSNVRSMSDDGRFIGMSSYAPDLVPGDLNGTFDCFVHDRSNGQVQATSVSSAGGVGNTASFGGRISNNGLFVTFYGLSMNLVSGDTNGKSDVFVHSLQLGTTERVSVDSSGGQANNDSTDTSISADGRFVVFASLASNLVPGDTNGVYDVFLRDRGAPAGAPFCFGDGSAGACPCANSGAMLRGCRNSASASGGAVLSVAGNASLASDTLVFTSAGELPTASTIFLQGTISIAPLNFGDGRRCTGGSLKRLYVHSASGGVVSAPQVGDPSVSARSAALGDVLSVGATRYHQAYYRDPSTGFCSAPSGNLWNISSGVAVIWNQ